MPFILLFDYDFWGLDYDFWGLLGFLFEKEKS